MYKRIIFAVLILAIVLAGIWYLLKISGIETVFTAVGSTFSLSLDGNITTGYSWKPSLNDGFLKESGHQTTQNCPEGRALLGCPDVQTSKFVGLKIGITTLKMINMRAWEGESSAIDKKTYLVVVF
jgi:predicted secreted protein